MRDLTRSANCHCYHHQYYYCVLGDEYTWQATSYPPLLLSLRMFQRAHRAYSSFGTYAGSRQGEDALRKEDIYKIARGNPKNVRITRLEMNHLGSHCVEYSSHPPTQEQCRHLTCFARLRRRCFSQVPYFSTASAESFITQATCVGWLSGVMLCLI